MKKFFALLAVVAMMAPSAGFAEDAVSEDEGTDINLFLRAELEESLKVIISNDAMVVDPMLPNEGTIHLDGGDAEKIDVAATRASMGECHNEDGEINYGGAAITCVSDADKASFTVEYTYAVELSGAGEITLDLSLNTLPPAADINFSNGEIESPESLDGAGMVISIEGLGHTDSGTISWSGDMEFSAGASFEDNIVVDISLL